MCVGFMKDGCEVMKHVFRVIRGVCGAMNVGLCGVMKHVCRVIQDAYRVKQDEASKKEKNVRRDLAT